MVDPGRGVSTFPPKEVSRPNPPRPNGVCVWVCVLRVRVRVRVSHIIVGFWPIFKKGHSKQEFFLLTELDKTRASPSPNTRQFRKSPNIGAGHTVANSKNRHSSLTFFFTSAVDATMLISYLVPGIGFHGNSGRVPADSAVMQQ